MASKINRMESELYTLDRWAWALYTALNHAPDKASKATLWGMLTNDQKAALTILGKERQKNTKPKTTQEKPPPTGPVYDQYGVKL
jgi:hypothetical protein